MGRVHQLITTHGFEEAKARAVAKLDRQCIEAAFAVMTDEEQRIGVMHAGFSMTALPHKDIEEAVWTRRGGSVRLRIDSGTDEVWATGRYPVWLYRPDDLALPTNGGCENPLAGNRAWAVNEPVAFQHEH